MTRSLTLGFILILDSEVTMSDQALEWSCNGILFICCAFLSTCKSITVELNVPFLATATQSHKISEPFTY